MPLIRLFVSEFYIDGSFGRRSLFLSVDMLWLKKGRPQKLCKA